MQDAGTELWAKEPSVQGARDSSTIVNDNFNGICTIRNVASAGPVAYRALRTGQGIIGAPYAGDCYRARLSDHEDPGDATVPGNSGTAPKTAAQFFAQMEGFEHQGSYDNEGAQSVTLYSILHLASQAKAPT